MCTESDWRQAEIWSVCAKDAKKGIRLHPYVWHTAHKTSRANQSTLHEVYTVSVWMTAGGVPGVCYRDTDTHLLLQLSVSDSHTPTGSSQQWLNFTFYSLLLQQFWFDTSARDGFYDLFRQPIKRQ